MSWGNRCQRLPSERRGDCAELQPAVSEGGVAQRSLAELQRLSSWRPIASVPQPSLILREGRKPITRRLGWDDVF